MFEFSDKALNYFYQANYVGDLPVNHHNIFMLQEGDATQITWLQLFLQIENKQIKQCKYRVQGGVCAIAAMEFLAEQLTGRTFDKLSEINYDFIIQHLQLNHQQYVYVLLIDNLLQHLQSLIVTIKEIP